MAARLSADNNKEILLRGTQRFLLAVIVLTLSAMPAVAQEEEREQGVDFFGDFRLRLEQDWDSIQGDGTYRDDRLRLRIRLRGGIKWQINDTWSALVQARTGPDLSQQSPHITIHDFDGGSTGPYEANLDHWFVRYDTGAFDAWAGRNELSFWHQDDMFVFDNVTYAGIGGEYAHAAGEGDLSWFFNVVKLPVGMRDFVGEGFVGQVAYFRESDSSGLTLAAALFATNADPTDPAGNTLLTENSTRDYRVLELQAQYRSQAFGKPFYLGLDLTHNFKDYDNAPPGSFSQFHKNDVDGAVVQVQIGETASRGDWLFGYYYAYLEALTVHSSYIQDDWVRWGSSTQGRTTNLKGSELRAVYTIRAGMNLFARLFFVDAINLLEPGDTMKETGNRFRIDFNVSF